jgi:hypothetical protein
MEPCSEHAAVRVALQPPSRPQTTRNAYRPFDIFNFVEEVIALNIGAKLLRAA